MKKLLKKLNYNLVSAKNATRDLILNERGDTNFISIAIILIVVIAIAVVFINFGSRLTNGLSQKIQQILQALGI